MSGKATITYLTLEGGVLVIDGNARINNLILDGGKILVTKSSSALLPSMKLENVTISNHGSIVYMGDVKMTSGGSTIINEDPDSQMDWGSSALSIAGNSTFINNGTAAIGLLRIESKNAKVILGPNSFLNLINLISNHDNRIAVPTGSANLSQAGFAQLPKSLTDSPRLIICPGAVSEQRALSNIVGGYGKANVMAKGCKSSSNAH